MAEPVPASRERFDEVITGQIRALFARLLVEHPELRSAAAVLDYYGHLNEVCMKGVWQSEAGAVQTADAVFGSLLQSLSLVQQQTQQAEKLVTALRDAAREQTVALVALRKEYEELKAKTAPTGVSEPPPAGGVPGRSHRPSGH